MPKVRGVNLKRELAYYPPENLSPVAKRLRAQAIALLEQEPHLVEAAYSFQIHPLEAANDSLLHVAGETLHAPMLIPDSGELTALGFGVATLGPRLEARITELFSQRRASLAVALDDLATEMLFTLGRRIQDRLLSETYKKRLSMGGELNAGDPGLAIETQDLMLRLAGAEDIGVSLYKGKIMHPLKSTSLVIAVGKDLPPVSWSRCETCPSKNKCNFGRLPLPTGKKTGRKTVGATP